MTYRVDEAQRLRPKAVGVRRVGGPVNAAIIPSAPRLAIIGRLMEWHGSLRLLNGSRKPNFHFRSVPDETFNPFIGMVVRCRLAKGQAVDIWECDDSLLFSAREINNLRGFVANLKLKTRHVSVFLMSNFSEHARRAVLQFDQFGRKELKFLKQLLAEELNKIVGRSSILPAKLFQRVVLRKNTLDLLNRQPQGEEVFRLNRLLIEDAYQGLFAPRKRGPTLVSHIPAQPQVTLFRTVHKPAPTENEPANPGVRQVGPVAAEEVKLTQTVQTFAKPPSPAPEVSVAVPKIEVRQAGSAETAEPKQAQPALASTKPSSPAPETSVAEAKTEEEQKPKLDVGPFRLTKDLKLVSPRRRPMPVQKRYAYVLLEMVKKRPDGSGLPIAALNYKQVVEFFERGKVEALKVSMTLAAKKDRVALRLKTLNVQDPKVAAQKAHDFQKQFAKWVRSKGIDPTALIKCERKEEVYMLSDGWAPHPLLGAAEVSAIPLGKDIESLPALTEDETAEQAPADDQGAQKNRKKRPSNYRKAITEPESNR